MMVYFFCAPEASEKFKKVFEEHRLARRLVSECSRGKNDLVAFVYEFCYFDDEKLTKISKYIGTYPNMPNFIIS